jgi:hypothetical protein
VPGVRRHTSPIGGTLAVSIVRRGSLPPRTIWLVLGVAVAMRLLTLTALPILLSDAYRYVWDGRVQLAGINPYRYLPVADELAFLRDEAPARLTSSSARGCGANENQGR